MKIYHTETQEDLDLLVEIINKKIILCQVNIKAIKNKNVFGRFIHRNYLAYLNGEIESYQSLLMQIRIIKQDKAPSIPEPIKLSLK